MGRQRDDRFRIARAERTRARDRRHDVVVGGSGGERPVDQQRILAPRRFDRACERIFEIGAERAQRILAQRDTGCHGVAAAFDGETSAHGVAHGAAEVDAGDRTPGAGADAARLERDGESGPSEPLLQSRGDEADDARVPAIGGGHDDGALLLDTERGHGLGLGLRQGGEFDRLTFAVESIELGREARAFGRIVLHEQIHPEGCSADAASGIDARSQEEAEMPRLGRAAEPGDIHQGGEPGIVAAAQRQQTLGDESAVETLEWHHVGDRSERHQIEEPEEVWFRPLRRPKSTRAQFAIDRDHGHEHEADGREVAERR